MAWVPCSMRRLPVGRLIGGGDGPRSLVAGARSDAAYSERASTGVDKDLEAVCLKCLQRDPAERYSSAESLAEELESWLRGEGVSVRPPGVWDWLRQVWRNKPSPSLYSWQALTWMGVLSLLVHGAVALSCGWTPLPLACGLVCQLAVGGYGR